MKRISVKSFLLSGKLVYKNMIWDRPKGALFGLIALALLLTLNFYLDVAKIVRPYGLRGQVFAGFLGLSVLALWFIGLPCVICLIDINHQPKRMQRLIETIPEYYDSSI